MMGPVVLSLSKTTCLTATPTLLFPGLFYLAALISGGGTASCGQDVKKESSWMTMDIPVRMYSLHILRTQRSSVGDRPEPFFGVL